MIPLDPLSLILGEEVSCKISCEFVSVVLGSDEVVPSLFGLEDVEVFVDDDGTMI